MKLHKRTMHVQKTRSAIELKLYELQREHELTDVEMLQCVNVWQATKLTYMLRDERHGDRDRKADEE